MAGFSQSTTTSTSSSTPTLLDNPYSQWGLQLSQLLSALGQSQYDWASKATANGQAITDQNIAGYLDQYGKGAGLADNLISQYKDVFKPIMDQYVQQAGTYNSAERQKFEAGKAESTVGQAATAARNESERKLQSFGVNPNSGRYQDLTASSRIADAAARAGAGTQASLDTADRGRAMTEKAAAMGQNVPGMAVNAMSSAYQGLSGAENAVLGMINTGAAARASAAPFFNAASGAIKMPPVGQNTKAQQQGQSSSTNTTPPAPGQSSGSRGGPGDSGGGGARSGSGGINGPAGVMTGQQGDGPAPKEAVVPMPPSKGGGAGSKIVGRNPAEVDAEEKRYGENLDRDNSILDKGMEGAASGTGEDDDKPTPSYFDPNSSPWWANDQGSDATFDTAQAGPTQTGQTDPNAAPEWDPQYQQDFSPPAQDSGVDPFANVPPDGQFGQIGGQDFGQQQDFSVPDQAQQTSYDPFGGQQQDQSYQDYSQPDQTYQDTSSDYGGDQTNVGDYDYGQQGGGQQDYGGGGGDYSGGYDEGYARGGPVQRGVLPTSGGHVPASAAQGRQGTDQVPARLNVGEFVIPRDVVHDHGTKFFRTLIEKSRRGRTGMGGPPAQGKMKPALRMRPTFQSRGM